MDLPVKPSLKPRQHVTRSYGLRAVAFALLRLALLLILVSAGTFTLLSFSPVDPIRAYIGNDLLHVPPQQYASIAARWGLDQPLWLRFWHWFTQIMQGDFGYSMVYNAPVAQVIGDRFALSFVLLASAWLLSGVSGIMMGLTASRYLNRWPDRLLCHTSYLLSSLPTFWVGLLLLVIFAVHWQWFPVCCAWAPGDDVADASIKDRIHHLILPMIALSLTSIGQIALHTRERAAETMQSDFVHFARAQGEKGWGLLRVQVLRHALTPALCLQFASVGELLGGSLLAEKVFAYPGLGQATIDAGLRGDIPLLMGIVLLSTLLIFCGNGFAALLLARMNRILEPAKC